MVILREGMCPGITAQLIQTLKQQNVKTVVDLVCSDLEELAQKCSVSYKTLVSVRRVLLAQYSPFLSNGADVYEELLGSTAILPTGNNSLDKLLDSGLYTGELTEFVGAPGSGKTQVCLSLAVNIACELKQKVVYVDSTGGLTASRLLQLVQSQAGNAEQQTDALQRIEVVRAFDVYGMLDVLQDLRINLTQQVTGARASVRAVVIDSVCAVLSSVVSGSLGEGMAIMMQLARALKTMARELGVAVVMTNGVVRDVGGGVKPALGRSWSYVPNSRILLQRGAETGSLQDTKRSATLLKSSRQPTGLTAELHITGCGTLQNQTATDALDDTVTLTQWRSSSASSVNIRTRGSWTPRRNNPSKDNEEQG